MKGPLKPLFSIPKFLTSPLNKRVPDLFSTKVLKLNFFFNMLYIVGF